MTIVSVDKNNLPTATPIGSLFINQDQTGFFFEKFPTKIPKNTKSNPNVCILAVNSSKWFWLKSLFRNKFSAYPAIKLYGQLGTKRKATKTEIRALKRRMRATRILKGHHYLWGQMEWIREITFTEAEKINLGRMTQAL